MKIYSIIGKMALSIHPQAEACGKGQPHAMGNPTLWATLPLAAWLQPAVQER